MSVTPTSFTALALSAAVDLLADSATWRTLCGASTAAQAKARIVLGDGGDDETRFRNCLGTYIAPIAPPFAVVSGGPARRDLVSTSGWRRSGRITIQLALPLTAGDGPEEAYTRAVNQVDGINDDLEALALDGRLRLVGLDADEPALGHRASLWRDSHVATLTLDWATP